MPNRWPVILLATRRQPNGQRPTRRYRRRSHRGWLALRVHGQSQVWSVSWQGWRRTELVDRAAHATTNQPAGTRSESAIGTDLATRRRPATAHPPPTATDSTDGRQRTDPSGRQQLGTSKARRAIGRSRFRSSTP